MGRQMDLARAVLREAARRAVSSHERDLAILHDQAHLATFPTIAELSDPTDSVATA